MKKQSSKPVTTLSLGIIGLIACMGSGLSYAAPPQHEGPPHWVAKRHPHHRPPVVIHRGKARAIRPGHPPHYRHVTIVRPHGRWVRGHEAYRRDHDPHRWRSFTAITVKLLDNLNEAQRREHEAAQIGATRANVGETISWHRGGASGAVTVVRDGTSSRGRYCREFQQEVTIGGNRTHAYGTACRNPDGSWEVASTGTP